MIELGVERQRPDSQQDECDIRIHNEGENPLLQSHFKRQDRLARQLQRDGLPVETLDCFSIDLFKQLFFV